MIKVEITEDFTEKVVKVITLSELEEMLNNDYDADSIIENRGLYTFRFIVE